jgi:Ser/Thr protein kinase RdoA (MazF antagonist)
VNQPLRTTPFPTIKSLLNPHALAQMLCEAYVLADVRCQLLHVSMRDVYLVTTSGQRFALCVYPTQHRTQEQIRVEWMFTKVLAENGAPVPTALTTRDADVLLPVDAPEGRRYAVLSHWLPGIILRRRSSPSAVTQYGQHLATIHLIADRVSLPLPRPVNDPVAIVEEAVAAATTALPDRPDVLLVLEQARDRVLPGLHGLAPSAPAYGMIHGDVIRANALVADDGRVAVLDFDLCGPGWRAYDVASYLFAIRGTADEAQLRQAFLDGYTDLRPLSLVEQATLPLFEAVRAFFDLGIPAGLVQTWGRAYLDGMLADSLAQVQQCANILPA